MRNKGVSCVLGGIAVKLCFTIDKRMAWEMRAYRRRQKSRIFADPLGAQTRFARLKGVFSSA